jgi:hypothetical protein
MAEFVQQKAAGQDFLDVYKTLSEFFSRVYGVTPVFCMQ